MSTDKKSFHVFYGWWIVGSCFLIALYTAGVIGYSFTAFFEPIAEEFGWSYTQVSLASSVRGLEMGLLAPLIGALVDRFGSRRIMFLGAILLGLGLLWLSRVQSLGAFYASFILIASGLSTCSNTAMIAAVAKWFRRKIGLAIGAMICGYGFSGFMVPVVVRLIDVYGWRLALVILGFGMFVLVLPLTLLVKREPEMYGQLPDGDSDSITEERKSISHVNVVDRSISSRGALGSHTFWYIAISLSLQHMVASAVITHVMPYLSSIDISRAVSGLIATGIPLMSIFGRLGFGWLGDKMSKKRLTAIGFGMLSTGLLLFGILAWGQFWLLVPFLILFGIGFGGTNTMRAILPREYFGAKNFGTILGFLMGVGTLGSIIGAPLAGFVFDRLGSYQPIWFTYAILAIVSLIIIATMPPLKVEDTQ